MTESVIKNKLLEYLSKIYVSDEKDCAKIFYIDEFDVFKSLIQNENNLQSLENIVHTINGARQIKEEKKNPEELQDFSKYD